MDAAGRPLGAILVAAAIAVFAHFTFSTFYTAGLGVEGVLRVWYALDIVMAASLLAVLWVQLRDARGGGGDGGPADRRRLDATAMAYGTVLLALALAWNWVDFLSKGIGTPQSETRLLMWAFVDAGFVVVAGAAGLRLLRSGTPGERADGDAGGVLSVCPGLACAGLAAALAVIAAGVALHTIFSAVYPDGADIGLMWDVVNFFMAFAIAVTLAARLGEKLSLDRGDGALSARHITVNLAFYASAMLALMFLWNWMDNFVNPDQDQLRQYVWSFINPVFVVLAGATSIDLWRRCRGG